MGWYLSINGMEGLIGRLACHHAFHLCPWPQSPSSCLFPVGEDYSCPTCSGKAQPSLGAGVQGRVVEIPRKDGAEGA